MNGISNLGQTTEMRVRLLTGYTEPFVEVKGVDINNTGATTINQVRAGRDAVPLVVYHASQDKWYVVPPLEVIKLVENRKGQHGVSSLETCTLTISKIVKFLVPTDKVKEAIGNAFLSEEQRVTFESMRTQYQHEAMRIAKEFAQKVTAWASKNCP